jgi:hypothetical protein
MILIIPPHRQLQVEVLVKAGSLLIKTFVDPGIQGITVAGTQGIGVKTPNLAMVPAMTTGLAGELHIPKVGILTIGAKSIIVAAGILAAKTGGPFGITINEVGATPKEHCSIAPIQTCCAIRIMLLNRLNE